MNLIELNRSLVQLRLSGMAAAMETRLLQAQSENVTPIDLISMLVSDELACRSKRLLERRHKQAQFRDPNKQLDNFDFQFNPKMNRSLVFDLATAAWIGRREDALFLGPAGSGKSHIAQAIGHAVIQQGFRVLFCERIDYLDTQPTNRMSDLHSDTPEPMPSRPGSLHSLSDSPIWHRPKIHGCMSVSRY